MPTASSQAITPANSRMLSPPPVLISVTSTIVGASLRPDSASREPVSLRGKRHLPQHREDRRRVGGRGDRPEQHRELPAEPEDVVAEHGHHQHADPDADGRQRDTEPHHRPDVGPGRGQSTFGQDQDQRGEAERVGKLGVVEAQPEAGLTERDAHQQVDEQAGQPEAHADAHGQDREEQHSRPDQENLVECLDVECHRVGTSAMGGRGLSL